MLAIATSRCQYLLFETPYFLLKLSSVAKLEF
jgi:hypothetical protein